MKVEKNKLVSIVYQLSTDGYDNQIIETVNEENPFSFVFGIGLMLPSFEKKLEGLQEGEEFKFKLSAEEAYGPYDESLVVDIPMEVFNNQDISKEDLLKIGNIIPMKDPEGNEFHAKIKEVGDNYVKMDFNHPLAGQDLFFVGKIISIRDATDSEIASGYSN